MLSSRTLGRILRWLPVILYCLLIYIQSSRPSPVELPDWDGADKLLHVAGYALLGALMVRALGSGISMRTGLLIAAATSLALAYGISDEIHQAFVPAREADVLDVAADGLGSFIGVIGYLWITRHMARIRSKTVHPEK